ncbi:MAG: colanic acid biosynthesis glycosyltransferase WcaL, partial [Calditrichaeota bacterium]
GFPRLSETFILNELLELERLGMRLIIFSLKRSSDSYMHTEVRHLRSPIIYVPEKLPRLRALRCLFMALPIYSKNPVRFMRVISEFLNTGKKERFFDLWQSLFRWLWLCGQLHKQDVTYLHAHFAHDPATMAYWIKRLLGCSYSFTAHAKDIYCYSSSWLKRKIHASQFVLTCTQYNKQHLEGLSLNGTPIVCLYHGINLQKFKPANGFKSSPPLLLSVGRLVEKKGFPVLLKACAILRKAGLQFKCMIVGDGPSRQDLQRQVKHLNLQECVQMAGSLGHDCLIPLYSQATLFVLPCLVTDEGDRDGIPNSILEAMAMELPVVSTRVSGISEAVEDGVHGFLVEENNPVALAHAMEQLLSNPNLAKQFGQQSRRKVERTFDIKQNVANLRELFLV